MCCKFELDAQEAAHIKEFSRNDIHTTYFTFYMCTLCKPSIYLAGWIIVIMAHVFHVLCIVYSHVYRSMSLIRHENQIMDYLQRLLLLLFRNDFCNLWFNWIGTICFPKLSLLKSQHTLEIHYHERYVIDTSFGHLCNKYLRCAAMTHHSLMHDSHLQLFEQVKNQQQTLKSS